MSGGSFRTLVETLGMHREHYSSLDLTLEVQAWDDKGGPLFTSANSQLARAKFLTIDW